LITRQSLANRIKIQQNTHQLQMYCGGNALMCGKIMSSGFAEVFMRQRWQRDDDVVWV
jgi:hypothetical protein